MNIDAIPLFAMLRSRLGYLTQREQIISQNVANSDTPNYAPRDLKAFSFGDQMAQQGGGLDSVAVLPGHVPLRPMGNSTGFQAIKAPDSETTLNGNQVVLEDQMMKMNEARMNYDAAIGFYQKSLSMLRMAARRPGG
jgi:flagellar basal-body rod protein FlgB